MINSVRLENFKNFRDATLNLGPFTVIVGTNASGKSNLRDAFRFLHGMAQEYSLADIVGEKFVNGALRWRGIRGGTREVARHGTNSFAISVNVDSELGKRNRFSFRTHIMVGNGARPLTILSESLYQNDYVVYSAERDNSNEARLSISMHPCNGSEEGVVVASGFSSIPAISQVLTNKDTPSLLEICSGMILRSFGAMRFLDLDPEAMRVPSIPGQPLGDRGENLSSAFLAICEDETRKQAMMEWIRQLTPVDVVDFEFPTDQVGRVLVALKEANGNVTSAYSASDGTLRFLALIAALMAPDAAQFYFLEEIDNGIHPTRLKLLIELIEQQTKKGKIQVVTSTHSPQLLSMLSPESREHAFLVYRHEHEADAQLQRIMDIPTAKEVLERHPLGRLLETGWLENTMDFTRDEATP